MAPESLQKKKRFSRLAIMCYRIVEQMKRFQKSSRADKWELGGAIEGIYWKEFSKA